MLGKHQTMKPLAILAQIAIAALLLLPTIPAANYGYGTLVGKSDYDYTPTPKAPSKKAICYFDEDSSNTYNSFEPIYFIVSAADCTGKIAHEDVRLTPTGTYKAGTEVKWTDEDWNMQLSGPLNDDLRMADMDGDGKFKSDDTLYLDIINEAQVRVNIGDLRLSEFGDYAAGTFARAGDRDVGIALTETGGGIDVADADAIYKAGSTYYVNVDNGALGTADTVVEDNDVRLLSKATNPFENAEALIEVVSVETFPKRLMAGQPMKVNILLDNNGTATGVAGVEIRLGDDVMDSRSTPPIAPGQSGTVVAWMPAPNTPGTYDLHVNEWSHGIEIEQDSSVHALRISSLENRIKELETALSQGVGAASAAEDEVATDNRGSLLAWIILAGVVLAGVLLSRRLRG